MSDYTKKELEELNIILKRSIDNKFNRIIKEIKNFIKYNAQKGNTFIQTVYYDTEYQEQIVEWIQRQPNLKYVRCYFSGKLVGFDIELII